ncbi:MAG: ketopantoate reductase family protein [Deferrisomatales bacterium]
MKIAIVGAGAMGCLFGARLARAGHPVTLVDTDPRTVAALAGRGVRLWEGDTPVDVPVGAAAGGAAAGPAELVLVLVKAPHTRAAAASLPALFGPTAHVLTLQNGLGAADLIAEAVGGERVLVGTTAQGATLLGPGEIRHGGAGDTLLGPYRGAAPETAGAIAAALTGAGLPARAVADPWPAVWRKLAVNCGINAVAALTGTRNGQLAEIPEAAALLADAVAEVAAVARVAGVDLGEPAALADAVLAVARATGTNRASMGQDVDRRARTEIEFINGAVVREGERTGVPTPVNQTLARLVKTLEATFP